MSRCPRRAWASARPDSSERLPTVSRAERQLDDINGSLRTQQQLRRAEQQTQFEVNQLRTQIQRDQTFPTPGSTRVCAPGQLGC